MKNFKRPTAWSYSSWSQFKQCPRRYYLERVCKLPTSKSPALERGIKLHELAENYLLGKIKIVPVELRNISQELEMLREVGATPECAYALQTDWTVAKDWFDKSVWLRAKSDAEYLLTKGSAVTIDFKTGKRYNDAHTEQGELLALVQLCANSEIEEIKFFALYVDSGELVALGEYQRSMVDALKRKWSDRAAEVINAVEHPSKPSKLCGWCPFSKTQGGQCGED